MADLFLMSGIPGAGKSTFLKNRIKKDTSVVISRDVIRFSIVKPEENYFSHEDEVLAIFGNRSMKLSRLAKMFLLTRLL